MIPKRKKYLYQLSNLSENSHIADYLVTIIEKIIVNIGPEGISAVVSDNVANVKNARNLIHEKVSKYQKCQMHHTLY